MNNMDNLTINTLRFLAAEAIQKAKSGHPGLPLARHLRHIPCGQRS